jgi:ergothioneine biosynthesis protein EgtC
MCRFVAYSGVNPILLKEIIADPENSLINQSKQAREGLHGINADGFGIAWYNQNIDPTPGVFKSIQPAWNDRNLHHIVRKIETNCFLGHVRASTVGDVTLNNCHPFTYENYSMVHNGTIRQFLALRRDLTDELDDVFFNHIKAQTDSEHLFALIMNFLHKDPARSLEQAVKKAFIWVEKNQAKRDEEHFSRLNIGITDGKEMIITRYVTKGYDPLSLYYASKTYRSDSTPTTSCDTLRTLVASEPLNDFAHDWTEVPSNHYLHITPDHQMVIKGF